MEVTLMLPVDTGGGVVSHGTRSFSTFKFDPDDIDSRWGTKVPPDVATYLIHNSGFQLVGEGAPVPPAPPETVRMFHPDGHGCSWRGVDYPVDEDGVVHVPPGAPEDIMPHGFLPAPPKGPMLISATTNEGEKSNVPAPPVLPAPPVAPSTPTKPKKA